MMVNAIVKIVFNGHNNDLYIGCRRSLRFFAWYVQIKKNNKNTIWRVKSNLHSTYILTVWSGITMMLILLLKVWQLINIGEVSPKTFFFATDSGRYLTLKKTSLSQVSLELTRFRAESEQGYHLGFPDNKTRANLKGFMIRKRTRKRKKKKVKCYLRRCIWT